MKLLEITQRSVTDLKIKYTGGDFFCSNNQLASLEGAPSHVGGDFFCSNNQLTSLKGAPSHVGGRFYCNNNKLTSLEGTPSRVGGDFTCYNNQLASLEGAPSHVGGGFFCYSNQLTSLKNIHKIIKEINGVFCCHNNPIKEGLLHILLIKGVTEVGTPCPKADMIINEYLKTNPSGSIRAALDVQQLLSDADVEYPR